MIIMLMKLRQRFPSKDLAYRYEISISTVSSIINTDSVSVQSNPWYSDKMFQSRELIQKHIPACFKSFKNTRVAIDCFEIIFVQAFSNFAEQGNMYSSYKNHATLKCLVAISPLGAITFFSDVYEGSISDKDITVKSGLFDLLDPGDIVIADRGFLIRDILNPRKVDINIPHCYVLHYRKRY